MRIYNPTSSTSLLQHSNRPLGQEKKKQCTEGHINRITHISALIFAWPPAHHQCQYHEKHLPPAMSLPTTAWIISAPLAFHPAAQTLWQQKMATFHTAAIVSQNHYALKYDSWKSQPTHSTPRANHCPHWFCGFPHLIVNFWQPLFPWSHRYPR